MKIQQGLLDAFRIRVVLNVVGGNLGECRLLAEPEEFSE